MVKLTVFRAGVLFALSFTAAEAASIRLSGTVRDFSSDHADFEHAIGGSQRGAVKTVLDADGKPVLVSDNPGGTNNYTTQENFSQWFRDVEGVNQSQRYDITLNETSEGSGLYSYASTDFFPADGKLGGNEGRAHNYHFTYEITGMMSFTEKDKFTFSGDDDLWFFVDDKLALDLGGVHPAETGGFTGADLMQKLSLTEGENYKFSIFFAERHTTKSTFKITTSLPLTSIVPLPASLFLLLTGMAGVAGLRFSGSRAAG